MRLKDEVVIVTGASRNIGAVYAKALAAEGAKIIAEDERVKERIMKDMQQVAFKDEVWPKFLRENACKVLKIEGS